MNQLSEASGAPSEILFDGTAYKMSPLSIGDMADFAQWAEDRAVLEAEKKIGILDRAGVATAEDKKAILQKVFDESESGILEARAMVGMPGIRRLAWLSLRHAHADITESRVGEIITMAQLAAFRKRLDRLSGMDPDPNDKSPAGNAGQLGEKSSAD
jgi:hypothetical protein